MNFLTNRPMISNVHHNGHICMMYYQDVTDNNGVTLTPEIKLDGVTKTCTVGTCNNLTSIHIPYSVFSAGNVLTLQLKDFQDNEVSSLYTFNIIHKGCDVVNVAWLNTKGGIDHYTFFSEKKVKISSEASYIERIDSMKAIQSKRYSDYVMVSDHEALNMRTWLSEIIGSPKIWMLPFTEVQLTESSLNTISNDLEQLSITLRPFRTKLQSL
ncbi:MAG: hypothetical protein WCX48_08480 [Bacteroidales bacterium]